MSRIRWLQILAVALFFGNTLPATIKASKQAIGEITTFLASPENLLKEWLNIDTETQQTFIGAIVFSNEISVPEVLLDNKYEADAPTQKLKITEK